MKFRKGDKVRYLNDVGGGTVVRTIDDSTVSVLNEFDFEVPVEIKELILVERPEIVPVKPPQPVSYGTTKESYEQESKEEFNAPEPEDDRRFFDIPNNVFKEEDEELKVYFALVPQNPESPSTSDLDVYLINDCGYELMYNYMVVYNDDHLFREAGDLEAGTKVFIESYRRADIIRLSEFLFQFVVYKKVPHTPVKPLQRRVSLNHTKLFKDGSFVENDYFNENSILLTVVAEDQKVEMDKIDPKRLRELILQKETENEIINQPTEFKSNKPKDSIQEVDLHIHNLVEEDYRKLSNAEMLGIQLDHFRTKLNEALLVKKGKIVFIHGIGNGTLKMELRKNLDNEYSFLKYQDASFKEYGFGATLVFLK